MAARFWWKREGKEGRTLWGFWEEASRCPWELEVDADSIVIATGLLCTMCPPEPLRVLSGSSREPTQEALLPSLADQGSGAQSHPQRATVATLLS